MEYLQDGPTDIFPEQQPVYASFWERFAAAFLDGLILMVINFFIGFLFGTSSLYGMIISMDYGSLGLLLQIIAAWLYGALMESSEAGATLGKRAMGIMVVNAAGNRITFGQATGRHFAKIISAVILFIGYLMMLWDDRSQALHDKIAGTFVVRKII